LILEHSFSFRFLILGWSLLEDGLSASNPTEEQGLLFTLGGIFAEICISDISLAASWLLYLTL